MCTTGAKILQPGHEFLLFKNRDFTRENFDDRVHTTDTEFGVLGLETWDADGQGQDQFSGFSIGFNRYMACCDSNVRSIPGAKNYDRLVQAVIEQCQTIDDAVACVREMVSEDTFSWANLIVATPQRVAALEVRDRHVEVQYHGQFLARANHHVVLGAHPADDDTTTTAWRYEMANQQLMHAQSLDDVFALLTQRHPEELFGISNFGQYNTVYSYVVHCIDDAVNFYVLQGRPSQAAEYTTIPVSFGQPADLSAYPSTHVSNKISAT